MTKGEVLYLKRMEFGWTLEEAAGRIGINKSTLWRYEMDEVQKIEETLMKRIQMVYHMDEEKVDSGKSGGRSCVSEGQKAYGCSVHEAGGMTDEELLTRYHSLDARSQQRIRILLWK